MSMRLPLAVSAALQQTVQRRRMRTLCGAFMSEELIPAEQLQLSPLFELAIQKGPDGVAALERLVALRERVEAERSRREFAEALARFQAEVPRIPKDAAATKATEAGTKVLYTYAPLETIERVIRPKLTEHGFSYRFESAFSESTVTVACILMHVGGHSERSSSSMPLAGGTSLMSPQQRNGSASSYARRYALMDALGLATCDTDDDGLELAEKVTPTQVETLEELIGQRPDGSRAKLLAWTAAQWGAKTMEEIPAIKFEWLEKDLRAKIAAQP